MSIVVSYTSLTVKPIIVLLHIISDVNKATRWDYKAKHCMVKSKAKDLSFKAETNFCP